MFFQINVTPKAKKCSESSTVSIPSKTTNQFTLVLAPFQPQTHIIMNAAINTTSQAFLTFKNINKNGLKLSVTKRPPDERCINLNVTDLTIEANGISVLEITWNPRKFGNWRDTLQVSDSRRIKYDIPLILNAYDPQKAAIKRKPKVKKNVLSGSNYNVPTSTRINFQTKNPTVSTSVMQPRAKRSRSPSHFETNKENIDFNLESTVICQTIQTKKPRKEQYEAHDFSAMISNEFCLTPLNSHKLRSVQDEDFNYTKSNLLVPENKTGVLRRETYAVAPIHCVNLHDSETENFDDSLSSDTLKNTIGQSDFSLLVNNVKFTPQMSTKFSFSPENCSTAQKNIQAAKKIQIDDNSTFDNNLLNHDNSADSKINETYEVSPKSSKTYHLKQTKLENNFESLSPVMPVNSQQKEKLVLGSSSPISSNSNTFNFLLKYGDTSTVKEVIEANLWAKPESANTFNITHRPQGPLEMIIEEDSLNKTKMLDLCSEQKAYKIEISPPHKPKINQIRNFKKVSPKRNCKINKEKHSIHEVTTLKKKIQLNKAIKDGNISIPGVRIAKLSLSGLLKKKDFNASTKQQPEKSVKLHDPDDMITRFCNPDPFAATMTEDPFLVSTLYYDEKWLHQQEIELTKWLNALLTAPEHLTTDVDTACIDVGKVWQSCRQKEDVILAETKETISARYHTNTRLNTLRKAAGVMFRNSEITVALSQTTAGIEKGNFVIREDRNLHRDIGLQKTVLQLFLSYNPLWLRIGLETIYGETIPLSSNNDLIGLTRFLILRFFSDPYLVKTHSLSSNTNLRKPTFMPLMNKFMVKKFFFLVYFLDYAKRNKLIGHDPCLFHKKSLVKDNRNILLTFSREVLSGMGDVTKALRNCGYVVSHKQTVLDEFDYAVMDLSSDLRDGVRLCRVMELITGQKDLTQKCRLPAISRLQKIHNVEVSLNALCKAGYTLAGEIEAKNIVDGHREKTLSLLWQVINKVQKPRFEKAAQTIQRWWRAKLWYVRIQNMLKRHKELAAYIIQKIWRSYIARKKLHIENLKRIQAARKILAFWLSKRQRLRDLRIQEAVLRLQRWWQNIRAVKPFIEELKKKRRAAIILQRRWRANILMREERDKYLKLKGSVIKIQERWRAKHHGNEVRKEYLWRRQTISMLQIKWRATRLAREERQQYLRKAQATRVVQSWWKQVLAQKRDRNRFLLLKDAVRTIEKRWIARNIQRQQQISERQVFIMMRQSIIIIQRSWRRYSATKAEVSHLKICKEACLVIQKNWRCAIISRQYHSKRYNCILIQCWWRAVTLGRSCRESYLRTQNAAIIIQKQWRMRQARKCYLREKTAAIKIQKWYRNNMSCRLARDTLLKAKNSIKIIKYWWLNVQIARLQRVQYLKYKKAVLLTQRKWRAILLARIQRNEFLKKKKAAVKIQSYWKMFAVTKEFKKKKEVTKVIQSWWKRKLMLMKKTRACIKIQTYWRATLLARSERRNFLQKKEAAEKIQSCWRMFVASWELKKMKKAVRTIQVYWKATLLARSVKAKFTQEKKAATIVQRYWRTTLLTRIERQKFLQKKKSAVKIQSYWRMFSASREFEKKVKAVKIIQAHWKATLQAKNERQQFLKGREAAVKVQKCWRAYIEMKRVRLHYLALRLVTLNVQRRFRANSLCKHTAKEYAELKKTIIFVQRIYRTKRLCRQLRLNKLQSETVRAKTEEMLRIFKAAVRIQAFWKGYKVRCTASKQMALLRERSQKATREALPSSTVAYKLEQSVYVLQYPNSVGQLTMHLCTLDSIMRFMPENCVIVSNFVDAVYDILTRFNRSLPWKDACVAATNILINLAKYQRTIISVAKVEHAETLARFLSITCEKHLELFLHAATLMWLLIHNYNYVEAITGNSRIIWLLKTTSTSILKVKSKPTPSTPVKSKLETLPCRYPDWHLKHQPRLFSSPQYAIKAILSHLRI